MKLFPTTDLTRPIAASGVLLLALLGPGVISARAAAGEREIVVSSRGGGDFRSIGEALNSLTGPSNEPLLVVVRNGLYAEKVWIRRSHLTLVGENRDSTRIVYPVLREEWNREHGGSDWGAGVVNIDTGVTDVTLANLTVYNNHGSLYGTYRKHQFAVRGAGTRIILLYCTIISDGGDALSLWDRVDGMYYHAFCNFEGWVDYVCPRGWCYITRSHFFGHNTPSASIWHDGSNDRSQKFVITDSFFDGVSGFPLGRNHLDGQTFLVRCRFSANMADRPFYRPPSSPRPWKWGDRHYYNGCHRNGGDYAWFRDNLDRAEGSPRPEDISARWAFDGKWDPEASLMPVLPFASYAVPGDGSPDIASSQPRLRWLAARDAIGYIVRLDTVSPPSVVGRTDRAEYVAGDLSPSTTYFWRVDTVTRTDTVPGEVWRFQTKREVNGGPAKDKHQ